MFLLGFFDVHFLNPSVRCEAGCSGVTATLIWKFRDVPQPQATRCICLYTLDFDPSGSVLSALVRVRVSLPLTFLVWWRTLGNAVLNGAKKPLTILSWTWYYNYSGWVTASL